MNKEKKDEVTIVLLHGAGLGSWIWDDMLKNLAYPALAIDFLGRGAHVDISTKGLSLSQYVASILHDIQMVQSKNIILVAHSISGILAIEIANQLHDRLVGLVAIGAVFPQEKGSYVSSMPWVNGMILRLILHLAGTQPPDSAIRKTLCIDLSNQYAQEVIHRFIPESKKLYTDQVQTQFSFPHSLYVNLKQDQELTEKIQQQMVINLSPDQVLDLNTGHLPMLSRPKELARILNDYTDSRCI